MSHTIFIRNRKFVRSIPGVGRELHRAQVEKTMGPFPYLSRTEELQDRKDMNAFRRSQMQTYGKNRWQMIQDAINSSRVAKLALAGKKDELDRLK